MAISHVQSQTMVSSETQQVSRREFLHYIWGSSIALLLAESCGTTIWFTLPREHFTNSDNTDFLRVEAKDIPAAGSNPLVIENKSILINTERGLIAFVPVCTHLGCLVKWVPANRRFECPCHLADYSPDGTMTRGEGTRDLDRYVIDVITDHGTFTTPANGAPISANGVESVVIKVRHKIMGQTRQMGTT